MVPIKFENNAFRILSEILVIYCTLISSSKFADARTTLKYLPRTYFHPGGDASNRCAEQQTPPDSSEDVAVYVKTRSVAVKTRSVAAKSRLVAGWKL